VTSQPSVSSHPNDTELQLTRVFDAPRSKVWKAWTDPTLVGRWWGPNGFTVTTEKHDFRVGGGWKYVMHGPDGVDYPNSTVYMEIVPEQRLVYRHGGGSADKPGVSFVATVTMEDVGGPDKTRVTLRMKFPTAEIKSMVIREYGAEEGGKQHLGRLAEFLGSMDSTGGAGGSKPFNIARTFDAPLDMVWRAWTDPARIAQWWGPRGFTSTLKTFELKPGGIWHCKLEGPNMPAMWGKYTFREVTPKSRLVFVVAFSNEAGGLTKHPMNPDWPAEILSEIDFLEAAGKTTVSIRWTPINPSEIERRTFDDGAASMTMGWTGTLDQLDAFLRSAKA
jgi:uncharacterized protein YndB with AHSA1/START domain